MKRFLLSVGVCATMAVGSAQAEGLNGFYVGGHVGYGTTTAEANVVALTTTGTLDSVSGDGLNVGIYAGWGRVVGQWLYLGLEAEAGWSDAEFEASVSDGIDTATLRITQDMTYGLAGRAGVPIGDGVMVYACVGFARTYFKARYADTTPASAWQNEWKNAIRYGIGLEYAAREDLLIRAEYTRTHYERESLADGTGNSASLDPREGLFRAGIAFVF